MSSGVLEAPSLSLLISLHIQRLSPNLLLDVTHTLDQLKEASLELKDTSE